MSVVQRELVRLKLSTDTFICTAKRQSMAQAIRSQENPAATAPPLSLTQPHQYNRKKQQSKRTDNNNNNKSKKIYVSKSKLATPLPPAPVPPPLAQQTLPSQPFYPVSTSQPLPPYYPASLSRYALQQPVYSPSPVFQPAPLPYSSPHYPLPPFPTNYQPPRPSMLQHPPPSFYTHPPNLPSHQLLSLPDPPSFSLGYPSRSPHPHPSRHKPAPRPRAPTTVSISELIKIEISRNTLVARETKNSSAELNEELVGDNPDIMKEVIPEPPPEEVTAGGVQCDCGKKFEKQLTAEEWKEHTRTRGHLIGMRMIDAQTSVELEARQIQPLQVLQAGDAITPAIQQFYEEVRPSQEDQQKRQKLCEWLDARIRRIYPQSSVLLFGSSACNLYFKNSDVDLVALLGENAGQHTQWSGGDIERTAIIRIAKQLHIAGIHDITKVLHSRVPILKKNTTEITGFAFDLCVDRPLGLFNSNLITYYMTLDSRVQPLLFVLKQWSKCVGINDSQRGRLSSYCINCMLIYFLQTRVPAVLPNVQAKVLPQVMVHGYDCAFERMQGFKSKNNTSIGVLLLEFFHFYGFLFDFEHDVVSIKMAQDPPPKKPLFKWNTAMCVQDPFETDFNLSRNVSRPVLLEILFQFQTAYIDLCNMKDLSVLWELAE